MPQRGRLMPIILFPVMHFRLQLLTSKYLLVLLLCCFLLFHMPVNIHVFQFVIHLYCGYGFCFPVGLFSDVLNVSHVYLTQQVTSDCTRLFQACCLFLVFKFEYFSELHSLHYKDSSPTVSIIQSILPRQCEYTLFKECDVRALIQVQLLCTCCTVPLACSQ